MQPEVLIEENSQLEYMKVDNQGKTAICIFHGYGASMMDLYDLSSVISTNFKADWFFPNGFIPLNMGMGMMARAWFPIDMQALEQAMIAGEYRDFSDNYPEEFQFAIDKCQGFVDFLKTKYENIVIGGFSQGAMISSHLSLKNADVTKALLLLSGNLIGSKQLLELTNDSKPFPFFQSHGKEDTVLGFRHAMSLYELLKLGGHEGEFVAFKGGHEIPEVVIDKTSKFLNRVIK
jgi:phospholipase/carboxylesterase